jgi:hypothetical protein
MKKELACLKRPWKSTNNASNVPLIFPNGTLSSGLRLHKRSGILFITDYLKRRADARLRRVERALRWLDYQDELVMA